MHLSLYPCARAYVRVRARVRACVRARVCAFVFGDHVCNSMWESTRQSVTTQRNNLIGQHLPGMLHEAKVAMAQLADADKLLEETIKPLTQSGKTLIDILRRQPRRLSAAEASHLDVSLQRPRERTVRAVQKVLDENESNRQSAKRVLEVRRSRLQQVTENSAGVGLLMATFSLFHTD